jgi:hypothetical protein
MTDSNSLLPISCDACVNDGNKQDWELISLVPVPNEPGAVNLVNRHGRYIAMDVYGNISAYTMVRTDQTTWYYECIDPNENVRLISLSVVQTCDIIADFNAIGWLVGTEIRLPNSNWMGYGL